MNKTPTQNKLIRFAIILSRIGKYLMLLAAAGFVILSVIALVRYDYTKEYIFTRYESGTLDLAIGGVHIVSREGAFRAGAFFVWMLAVACIPLLSAMICKNVGEIFNAEQPFCRTNIDKVRDIGIYVLAFPALQVVLPVVMGLFYGETISVQLDPSTIFFGLVILALAQFFQYGASLEDDVDGLL